LEKRAKKISNWRRTRGEKTELCSMNKFHRQGEPEGKKAVSIAKKRKKNLTQAALLQNGKGRRNEGKEEQIAF